MKSILPPQPWPSVGAIPMIVVTGGPGAGKSTALPQVQRRLEADGIKTLVVPEVARQFFESGIRFEDVMVRGWMPGDRVLWNSFQRAIFHSQLENEQCWYGLGRLVNAQALLCDRGTVDGAAYMVVEDFHKVVQDWMDVEVSIGQAFELLYGRYAAVVYMETAAKLSGYQNDPNRQERHTRAIDLCNKVKDMWIAHPRFTSIPATEHFEDKIERLYTTVKKLVQAT